MQIFTESDGFVEATDYKHSAKPQDVLRYTQIDFDINNSPGLLCINS